jgi:hypothetical protein
MSHARRIWLRGLILFSALLAGIGGCSSKGPQLAEVRGKVTMDGQPLANVIVTFVPDGGGISSSGVTDEGGTYQLACPLGRGAVVGKHRVFVQSQPPSTGVNTPVIDEDDPSYKPDPYASVRAPAFVEKIPARYNAKSELVREVKPGSNVIDLELSSQP